MAAADPNAPLAQIAVTADSSGQVAALSELVRSFFAPSAVDSVTIETSTELATIRLAVKGELGRFGRGTVLGILAVSALLVGACAYASVMLRRRDFGRRRALGARQGLLISLLSIQTTVVASLGVFVGCAGALVALAASGDSAPGVEFMCAVGLLAVLCAVLATLLPAFWVGELVLAPSVADELVRRGLIRMGSGSGA